MQTTRAEILRCAEVARVAIGLLVEALEAADPVSPAVLAEGHRIDESIADFADALAATGGR